MFLTFSSLLSIFHRPLSPLDMRRFGCRQDHVQRVRASVHHQLPALGQGGT